MESMKCYRMNEMNGINEMESMNGITDVCVYIHTKLLYYVSILQKFIKKKAIKFVFDGDLASRLEFNVALYSKPCHTWCINRYI